MYETMYDRLKKKNFDEWFLRLCQIWKNLTFSSDDRFRISFDIKKTINIFHKNHKNQIWVWYVCKHLKNVSKKKNVCFKYVFQNVVDFLSSSRCDFNDRNVLSTKMNIIREKHKHLIEYFVSKSKSKFEITIEKKSKIQSRLVAIKKILYRIFVVQRLIYFKIQINCVQFQNLDKRMNTCKIIRQYEFNVTLMKRSKWHEKLKKICLILSNTCKQTNDIILMIFFINVN